MDVQTLPQISIPPSPCPKSSSPKASVQYPETGSSSDEQQAPESPKRRSTCPFAVLSPTPTPPPGHPPIERRCPRWVRVLRFSAKFVAKQVVLRTMKKALKGILASLRKRDSVPKIAIEEKTA